MRVWDGFGLVCVCGEGLDYLKLAALIFGLFLFVELDWRSWFDVILLLWLIFARFLFLLDLLFMFFKLRLHNFTKKITIFMYSLSLFLNLQIIFLALWRLGLILTLIFLFNNITNILLNHSNIKLIPLLRHRQLHNLPIPTCTSTSTNSLDITVSYG